MTAPADLDAVRAALAMVAQATPGPWSARIFTTHVVDSCQQTQWHEVGSQHGTICEAPPSVFEDETAIGASNIRAIVALHNAAPAIAAAVEELEDARAEIASAREQLDRLRSAIDEREGDMHMRIRAGYDKTVADAWRAVVAKRDAEIAALRRQVCRLTSGDEIEGDRLCQHHGAEAAALALLSDERAAHAETSRDLDALLTALGAQVTPGGQTLESCHARRVADGMRRAAGSAPAKCSCTSEAGDSRCLAHPTCSECGVFTPSCVDSCDDHAKAIADAEERGRTDGTLAPHDVEVAISDLVAASRDLEVYAAGKVTAKRTKSAERSFGRARTALRAAIAAEIERGLVSARARFDCARSVFFNDMLRRRNITSPCQECEGYGVLAYPSSATWRRGAGGQMSTYDVCDRCWGSGDAVKHGVDQRRLGAEIERARAEGRAEAPAAPATVARPISEWHEDRGSALWWRFPVEEPPYSGSPLDSDWPGYHTHWTPIVCPDEPHDQADADPASRGPIDRPPVCSTCNDTHAMTIGDRTVMCTRCPTPCQSCRAGGNGPFCGSTPCTCECHAKIGGGS